MDVFPNAVERLAHPVRAAASEYLDLWQKELHSMEVSAVENLLRTLRGLLWLKEQTEPDSPQALIAGVEQMLAAQAAVADAEITVPDDGRFVLDRAGLLQPEVQQKLETWLTELEQKTTAQGKLLTVPTNDGEDVFGFSQRHAERWKLGQRGKDNGALIVLAVAEREVRIHTGYGLESVLPDSWCGSASREVAGRYFKQGDYSSGLDALVTRVIHRIAGDAEVTIQGVPKPQPAAEVEDRGGEVCFIALIILFVILHTLFGGRRGRRRWGRGLVVGGSSYGGRSSGGRSFGGGSFGGGRFGGGGARW
jgi:uncharacterized protein